MTNRMHALLWALALTLPASQVAAQLGGGNPMEEIKEIAEAVDKQLKEDRPPAARIRQEGPVAKRP